MKKEVLELEVKTGKSEANINDVVEAIKDLNKSVSDGNKKTEKSFKGVEQQGKKTSKVLGGISKLFKGALGIGIVVQAFDLLKETFTANQKVANLFSNVTETISIVFNQLVDAVVKGSGEFNALGKVLNGLLTISITPLKLAFYGVKLGLQQAQLAWEDSFFGGNDEEKIKQLNLDILETKKNLLDTGTDAIEAGKDIYNNFSEAVEGISNISVKAAYEQAQINTQLERNAKLATVANQGLIEQYDREAEVLRQLRDDTSKSIEERIEANNKLGLVLEEQQKLMQQNAQAIVDAAQAQYNKNKNDENAIALQEALNEQAAIDAQITGFKSEQQTNLNSLLKEQKDIQNELSLIGKSEVETAKIEAEQKLQTQIDFINREVANEEERNALLLEARKTYDEEIRLIDEEQAAKKKEKEEAEEQKRKEQREKQIAENKERLQQEIELENQRVESKRNALDAIMSITNQESALGKAAFIAKQILGVKEMINEARKTITFSSLVAARSTAAVAEGTAQTAKVGFPQNIPLLIGYAAQAVGIIGAVKQAIGSAKSISGGIGAGGGSTPNIQAPNIGGASAPSFNIVGQGGTNQLAQSIGQQEKQPVKAFVVASDVSTAQSMERNIVQGASIG